MKSKLKKGLVAIIIIICVSIVLWFLDRITHWSSFISNLLIKFDRSERLFVICVILLSVIVISTILIRQYENKSGERHETVRLILKILILTMLGNFCMSVIGGIATNELYHDVLGYDEFVESSGKNDDSLEEYVSENNRTEYLDISEFKYPSVDKFIVGWSDNSGLKKGRPFYKIDEINNGVLGDQIIFNSISDSGIGIGIEHEANFVGARENTGINVGARNKWNSKSIEVENGKTYFVRLYVHNNSPYGWDAVALDTRVRFEIGDTVFVTETENNEGNYQAAVYGYITSSNAKPSQYMDGVRFMSGKPFHLAYIPGTALYENNGIGSGDGCRLSDDVITKGVLIGYDVLNGEIPGCYEYASYTTIKVMPVFDD